MPLPTSAPAEDNEPENKNEGAAEKPAAPQPFVPPRSVRPAKGLPTSRPEVPVEPAEPKNTPSPSSAAEAALADELGGALTSGAYVGSVSREGGKTTNRAIGSDHAINTDYDKVYLPLEKLVKATKEVLQGLLTEHDLTQQVAIGRANRNSPQYQDIRAKMETFLFRHFSQQNITTTTNVPIIIDLVVNEILGYGPIEPLWHDPRITEIMINGPRKVRIEINGRIQDAKGVKFRDREHLLEVCQQILAPLNRTLDMAHPYEDGRLSDGSRVNLTHWVIGPGGPYVTIRRFPEESFSLRKLLAVGSMNEEMAEELGNLIHAGSSTLVSGGTGTGKTSALNALSGCIPMDERIITIEDTLELRLHPERDVVAMEAVKARNKGDSEGLDVSIRDLVKNSLRQRPDRIIVGEVRDASAYDMLQAMITGHEGSMTTVHANNPVAAIDRLSGLVNMAGGNENENQSLSLIANAIDIIIQLQRYEDGSRRVAEIAEIPARTSFKDNHLTLEPRVLWRFVQTGTVEDEEGKPKIVGHHERVNPLSDDFIARHRLAVKEHFSLEQLLTMSDLPDANI